MNRTSRAAAAAYVVLSAADTALAGSSSPRARRARRVTKPLLMPTLAVATRAAAGEGASRLTRTTVAAQALSCGGDVALLGSGDRAFLTGLSSFFAAHVAYVAGFASTGRPWAGRDERGVAAAAAALAVLGPTMSLHAGRESAALRAPVAAYTGVLSSMFATSTRLDSALPADARRMIVIGTALFLASDTILATREFVLEGRPPAADVAVMATYTAAQGLIAAGVVRATREA